MNYIYPKIFLLSWFILFSGVSISQTLSGIVIDDKTSEVAPDSQVYVVDEMNKIIDSTKTDDDGKFTLTNVYTNALLKVRAYGYEYFETEVRGQNWMEVRLKYPETTMMGDMVSAPGEPIPTFPWPPPIPSTKTEIPTSVFKKCRNLGDVNDILKIALVKNGYSDNSYFLVPANDKNGFALATQLEQIDKDRVSKKDPNRWNTNILSNKYVGWEYLAATLLPNPGFFRVIVFIVTDIPFVPKPIKVDQATAQSWLYMGSSGFPDQLRGVNFNRDYKVYVLVYEYEQKKAESDAVLLKPSKYNAQAHLKKAQVWNTLLEN